MSEAQPLALKGTEKRLQVAENLPLWPKDSERKQQNRIARWRGEVKRVTAADEYTQMGITSIFKTALKMSLDDMTGEKAEVVRFRCELANSGCTVLPLLYQGRS